MIENMKQFKEGWNIFAKDLIIPDSVMKPGEPRFFTWEERVANLTPAEAYKMGFTEGKSYYNHVRIS